MSNISTEIEYVKERGMWVVTVYVAGLYDSEHWFHTVLAANEFAARRKLWGNP